MKINKLWEFSNPSKFEKLSNVFIPTFGILALSLTMIGIIWGAFYTPDDYRQGSLVKIIYVHVPSAFLAINIYLMMFVSSLIWLIRRHHLSAIAAKAAAPLGLGMTIIAITTLIIKLITSLSIYLLSVAMIVPIATTIRIMI